VNSTILIAVSSSLTALAGIVGTILGESPYVKYGSIIVVIVTTVITIFQSRLNEKDASFTKRCLSNLIRSARPSEYVRKAIFQIVSNEATKLGMPSMHSVGFASQKYMLEFRKNEQSKRIGLLGITPEIISDLSLYDEQEVLIKVNSMILKYGEKKLNECWGELSEEIALISELVFAYHLQRPSRVNIWANVDEKYIAIGPPDCPDDTPPHERAEFGKAVLQDLIGMNALKRGAIIADSAERLVQR
jgi:hypothetical protein